MKNNIFKEYPRQNLAFIGINCEIPVIAIQVYCAAWLVALRRLYSNQYWASAYYYGSLAAYGIGSIYIVIAEALFQGNLLFNDQLHIIYCK